MSIAASITGVFVMLIRLIKNIPRRVTIFLWLIPFFRMAIPIALNSPYSFMSLFSRISTVSKTIVIYQPTEKISLSLMNSVGWAKGYFPITYKFNILDRLFDIASIVWIIIFSAIFLMLTFIYFATIIEMKDARYLRDNLYISDKIASPAVYGIIKPKIILPLSFMDKDIEYILLHENIHISRKDNLLRMLAFAITAVHWFNPLAWIFLKLFLADLELSCDECVLVKLGAVSAKEYALSLLEYRESGTLFTSAFGGAKIKTRIENILSFKEMTLASLIIFCGLIFSIFYLLLTNAS